jgi:single-strand DNA-binding protein
MNKFIFTGNLGKDAEVKVTQSGMSVCSFSVAVKSGYGDKQKTTWVNCALFGKRAEGQLPQYLKKGAQVAISGELTLDEWEGKDGTTQKSIKVNVDDLDLIGGKPEGSAPARSQSQAPAAPAPGDDGFDDIPFN